MSDSTEMYYAHMEADRNEATDAYFRARPGFGELERSIFRAGFERAYAKLWPLAIVQIDEKQRAKKETRPECQHERVGYGGDDLSGSSGRECLDCGKRL